MENQIGGLREVVWKCFEGSMTILDEFWGGQGMAGGIEKLKTRVEIRKIVYHSWDVCCCDKWFQSSNITRYNNDNSFSALLMSSAAAQAP